VSVDKFCATTSDRIHTRRVQDKLYLQKEAIQVIRESVAVILVSHCAGTTADATHLVILTVCTSFLALTSDNLQIGTKKNSRTGVWGWYITFRIIHFCPSYHVENNKTGNVRVT